jgi:hypothetical protein
MVDIVQHLGKFAAICRCGECGEEYEVKNKYGAQKSPIGHLCTACKTAISGMENPDQAGLLSVFTFDPSTGALTHRRTTSSGMQGELATFAHSRGYLSVCVGKQQYLAHRIIFMMMKGYWPEHVDHINHIKHDNRWENLREVTQADNNRNMPKQLNSATGYVGVSFHKARNKYRAYLTVDGKSKHLGLFDTPELAAAAREQASAQYGYHENHGK